MPSKSVKSGLTNQRNLVMINEHMFLKGFIFDAINCFSGYLETGDFLYLETKRQNLYVDNNLSEEPVT